MKNPGFKKTIDLIELSDAFRRHAAYQSPDDVKELVEEGRKIAALSTHYYPEYPNMAENNRIDDMIVRSIERIAETAQKLDCDSVVLPLSGDSRSWTARRVEAVIAKEIASPVTVKLQKGTYKTDLSSIGPIDKTIKTALDSGVRGVVSIQSKLLYRWGN